MNLNDRTILLTGASTGIGKSLAYKLAKENCNLILIARRIDLLIAISNDLEMEPATIYPMKCDVTNKYEVKKTYEEIRNKFDRIDIAILNAGIGHTVTVKNYNSKYAEEIFNTNVFGKIYWIEVLLPEFLERKSGTIVGITSLADNRGFSGSGFYCASKAAASVYLEGLRVELKKYNIKVITVKPGFVKTPMTDKNKFKMPFLMSADKAAQIILDGIKKEKRIIQFPIPTIIGSKIISLLPAKLYEALAEKYFK